jgi:hypothetical protein
MHGNCVSSEFIFVNGQRSAAAVVLVVKDLVRPMRRRFRLELVFGLPINTAKLTAELANVWEKTFGEGMVFLPLRPGLIYRFSRARMRV